MALQSLDPYFTGNAAEAASLLDQAAQLAELGSSARRRAWIEALRARAHAAVDDRWTAKVTLASAYAAIGAADRPTGTDFFDRHRLDGLAGTTYMLLRDTDQAVDLISQSIQRRPYADAKGRALLTLDQAACMAIDQSPDEATSLVHDALDLADGQLVRPIVVRAQAVRGAMAIWRGTEPVRTLDERLASLGRDCHEGT